MQLGSNPELDTSLLRYVYTSLTTPATTYDYDVLSGERHLRKREPVLGDFDPSRYASEFLWAQARDGELVPVSVVYRKDTRIDGTAPLYLYAYGSYGLSTDPAFSSARLSLLDRGFVYAIAHVRGGQERGRRWYEAGRLGRKWNTFNDFVDVTDFLVARGYGARDRVFAAGGSAGGLLVGVIGNVAPQKYRGLSLTCRSWTSSRPCSTSRFRSRRSNTRSGAIRTSANTTNTCSRTRLTTTCARRLILRCS